MRISVILFLSLWMMSTNLWAANGDSLPITLPELQKIVLTGIVPTQSAQSISSTDTTILRSRVLFSSTAGTRAASAGGATSTPLIMLDSTNPNQIIVRFFDNALYTVRIDQIVEGYAQSTVFSGTELSAQWQTFTLVKSADGDMLATFRDVSKNREYQLAQNANGVVSITERDITCRAPRYGESIILEVDTSVKSQNATGAPAEKVSANAESFQFVDVMIVFEVDAIKYVRTEENTTPALYAEKTVADMNTYLANSGLSTQRFRLCYPFETAYKHLGTENDRLLDDLTAFRGNTGALSKVNEMRDNYGADVCTLLLDHGSAFGYVGIGYALTRGSNPTNFGNLTYSACAIRSGSATVAHEIGHNLGAGHSRNQEADPGPQFYEYSSGHYLRNKYHTIMAYNNRGNGDATRYTQAPLFSTPNKQYDGITAGTANRNDNARGLSQMWPTAVDWRSADKLDAFEPDNTLATAKTLTPTVDGTAQKHTLGGVDIADYIAIPIKSGFAYTLQISPISANAILYDGNEETVVQNFTLVNNKTLTYNFMGTRNTTYYIKTMIEKASSPFQNYTVTVSEIQPLPQAQNLQAGINATNGIELAWTSSEGNYVQICRGLSPADIRPISWVYVGTKRTYLDRNGLTAGRKYYYAIRVADDAQKRDASELSDSAMGFMLPNPRVMATKGKNESEISVSWPVLPTVEYKLFRSATPNDIPKVLMDWCSDSTYLDADRSLIPGRPYKYIIETKMKP